MPGPRWPALISPICWSLSCASAALSEANCGGEFLAARSLLKQGHQRQMGAGSRRAPDPFTGKRHLDDCGQARNHRGGDFEALDGVGQRNVILLRLRVRIGLGEQGDLLQHYLALQVIESQRCIVLAWWKVDPTWRRQIASR